MSVVKPTGRDVSNYSDLGNRQTNQNLRENAGNLLEESHVFFYYLDLIGWKSDARKRDRANLSFHMQVKRALDRITFCIYRYLSGNQLTCDCKLYGVFNASQHLPTFTGTCFKPDELRGKNIKSLKLLEFCRKYF